MPVASAQSYRDQGPGADELHITAEALPCQKALHVHMQLMPQCKQGLVLGLQSGRSGAQSGALPTVHGSSSNCPPQPSSHRHPPGHPPGDGLLGLLVGRGHKEAHGGHGSLTARVAEHLPVGWLCRAHQLALVTLVHGNLRQPEVVTMWPCLCAYPAAFYSSTSWSPHLHLLVVTHS